MAEITTLGIVVLIASLVLVISFVLNKVISPKLVSVVKLRNKDSLYKIFILLALVTLFDFYFVSIIPFVGSISEVEIQALLLFAFMLVTAISYVLVLAVRDSILDIQVSGIARNERFLKLSLDLILVQLMLVTLFYFESVLAVFSDIDTLPGVAFLFDTELAFDLSSLETLGQQEQFMILILTGIKGAFLLIHHGSIIVVFVTLFAIFQEWNSRTHETPINYFTLFSLGFVLQGVGQSVQAMGLFFSPFLLTSADEIPAYLSILITVGGFVVIAGMVVYFISFLLAGFSLLGNISHLLAPNWLKNSCKVALVFFPFIYALLYSILGLLNLFWFIGLPGANDLGISVAELIHLLDFPAIVMLPFASGLFFLVAFRQSRSKEKGKELGQFVLWTFLSLFFLFTIGNNTMSNLTWFGMLHGPLSLFGAILLLFGLSRVADHASRHRRVIKTIRENPDDFAFLHKLGEAERRIQVWAKVDSLVKTGVIKPLVPSGEQPSETQVAQEVSSYMDEITTSRRRERKRKALPT